MCAKKLQLNYVIVASHSHIVLSNVNVLIGISIPIAILNRYADQRIDLADACLIWLAGQERTNRVLTVDHRDFSVYRTPGGQPFERLWISDDA